MTESDQVSQETDETVETDDGLHPTFKLPLDHPAIKALEEARRDAGGQRVKKNKVQEEMAEKAAKWEEHVRSQKTELERLAEDNAAKDSELKELRTEKAKQNIADEFGLDAELRETLIGDENQMRKTAEILAKKVPATKDAGMDLLAGDRGKPVGQKTDAKTAGGDWFKANFL